MDVTGHTQQSGPRGLDRRSPVEVAERSGKTLKGVNLRMDTAERGLEDLQKCPATRLGHGDRVEGQQRG